MIAIDLLPPEDAGAAAARRRARAIAIGIAVVAGLALLLGHAALETSTLFSRRRLTQVDAELAALERPVAALRRLRQRQAALRQRLGVIAGLEARGGGPVPLLDALAVAASRNSRSPRSRWSTRGCASRGSRSTIRASPTSSRACAQLARSPLSISRR